MDLVQCMMKSILLIWVLLVAFGSHAATIRGRVTGDKGEALIGAVVVVPGTSFSAPVDAAGHYEITNLPAGSYSVRVTFVGYQEGSKAVVLRDGATIELNFVLQAQVQRLAAVTVVGKLNREEDAASRRSEKTADNVINVIASRAIERSPDINVANVLTRVSGVTVQRTAGGNGGAYASIRGMEPRYNNTLVDGVKVASPDAQTRFVPLDIIPSDLIQRIEVHKALLPSMEGDAVGGTVNIVTKVAPDTMVLLATAAVGYSQLFLDRQFVWFNKADIRPTSSNEAAGRVVTSAPGDFSRRNLTFSAKQAPANSTAGLTYGRRFFNKRLGVIVAGSWQDQYFGSNGAFTDVKPQLDETRASINVVSAPRLTSSRQANAGLMTHLDFIINLRNKLGWHNLVLLSDFAQARTSTDSSLVDQHTIAGTGTVHDYRRTLTQRQLVLNSKLEGVHELRPNLLLDWAALVTDGRERAPDWATLNLVYLLRVDPSDPAGRRIQRTQSFLDPIDRLWRHNDNRDYSGLLNLSYQPTVLGHALDLKVGGLYRTTTRYNRQDDYTLKATLAENGAKQVFTTVEAAQWEVYNTQGSSARDPSNYDATEAIAAGYAQAKVEFGPLQVLGGVRLEHTNQHFTTLQAADILTDPNTPDNFTVAYQDVLPSLHLRYAMGTNQNLRLSYFAGLSRPSLTELNPNLAVGAANSTVGNLKLRLRRRRGRSARHRPIGWRPRHLRGATRVHAERFAVVGRIDEAEHDIAHAADRHHAVAGIGDDDVSCQRPERACYAFAMTRRRGRVEAAAEQQHRGARRADAIERLGHLAARPRAAQLRIEALELRTEVGTGRVAGAADARQVFGTHHRQVHAGREPRRLARAEERVDADEAFEPARGSVVERLRQGGCDGW